jgi:hypothetical protein
MKEGIWGMLNFRALAERHFLVRLPENVKISEVKASVNNRNIHPEIKDGFLNFGKLRINDFAEFNYPMKNYVKEEHIAAGNFRFTYQGSTVTKAEPRQKFGEYFTNQRFIDKAPAFTENRMDEIDSL